MNTFSLREPKFPECEHPKSGEKIQKICKKLILVVYHVAGYARTAG